MPSGQWSIGAHALSPGVLGGVLVATFYPQPYMGRTCAAVCVCVCMAMRTCVRGACSFGVRLSCAVMMFCSCVWVARADLPGPRTTAAQFMAWYVVGRTLTLALNVTTDMPCFHFAFDPIRFPFGPLCLAQPVAAQPARALRVCHLS